MTLDTQVREQLQTLLTGENAHMTFEQAVADFPLEHINTKPPHVSYEEVQIIFAFLQNGMQRAVLISRWKRVKAI